MSTLHINKTHCHKQPKLKHLHHKKRAFATISTKSDDATGTTTISKKKTTTGKRSAKSQQLDQLLSKHNVTSSTSISSSPTPISTPDEYHTGTHAHATHLTHNVHSIKPKANPFFGQSDPAQIASAFNPDLSKAQMYQKATNRHRKINALDLSNSPSTPTGQQFINKNWGVSDVINFLSNQKISQMVVFDTSAQSPVCDFTIVCNVPSSKPMQSLVQKLVAFGRMNKGLGHDGYRAGDDPDGLWAVAELGHIVVHVLTPAGRTSPMFQRVERKLLNDAKLIAVSQWDKLLDPWEKQDKQVWSDYNAGKMIDWEEMQAKYPHLMGQPPPPGYYIRANARAIDANYDDLTDQDQFDYLDVNEVHSNKIQLINEMGYTTHTETNEQTNTQIDYDMIDKVHFGKIEIIKPTTEDVVDVENATAKSKRGRKPSGNKQTPSVSSGQKRGIFTSAFSSKRTTAATCRFIHSSPITSITPRNDNHFLPLSDNEDDAGGLGLDFMLMGAQSDNNKQFKPQFPHDSLSRHSHSASSGNEANLFFAMNNTLSDHDWMEGLNDITSESHNYTKMDLTLHDPLEEIVHFSTTTTSHHQPTTASLLNLSNTHSSNNGSIFMNQHSMSLLSESANQMDLFEEYESEFARDDSFMDISHKFHTIDDDDDDDDCDVHQLSHLNRLITSSPQIDNASEFYSDQEGL